MKNQLPSIEAATAEFSRIIREWLTDEQLAQVRAGTAHVDDFCDSNQALLNAIDSLVEGFEENTFDPRSQEQTDMMETIWNKALEQKYV